MRESSRSPAITALTVAADTVSWWQDAEAGGHLVSVDPDGVAEPHPALTQTSDQPLWTVIGCVPGPKDLHAVVIGRPGSDYGYLYCVSADRHLPRLDLWSLPLVRRPSIVWAPDGSAFVYTRLGIGIPPDQLPPDGTEVAVHRSHTRYHADRVLLPKQAAHTLVALEPAAVERSCLLRVADGRRGDYYLLDYGRDEPAGPRVRPLVQNASARTQLVLGSTRWWVATGLGTTDATLLALPPGNLDHTAAEPVELTAQGQRLHPAQLAGSLRRLAVRAVSPAGEHVVAVEAETLKQTVLAGERPSTVVTEVAGSVHGSVLAWAELADGALRVRALPDPADSAATHVQLPVPAPAPVSVRWYQASDGERLPLYVSRSDTATGQTPVVVLPHAGTAALLTAPLDRALDQRCAAGELVLVRAAVRSLRSAVNADGGARAYDDLLAACRVANREVAGGRRVALVGSAMTAIPAARAALLDPNLFRCVVLRFPVADLLRFPELGVGRHWITLLGDPAKPADRTALRALSPCHLKSSGRAIPPVLLQIGRFDTRAHPEHGRRLFERLRTEPGASPELSEFALGHVERLGCGESTRAVADTMRFLTTHLPDQARN